MSIGAPSPETLEALRVARLQVERIPDANPVALAAARVLMGADLTAVAEELALSVEQVRTVKDRVRESRRRASKLDAPPKRVG